MSVVCYYKPLTAKAGSD